MKNKWQEKYTVLLCEDNESISLMYSYRLEIEGLKVVIINSGDKVIKQMKLVKPHIVVLDLMMPRLNGFDVLSEINQKDNEDIQHIPVIVATHLREEDDVVTVKELGAIDFINKSDVTPKEVYTIVAGYLENIELSN
jgi:DNA-binding response OmpR family regulator